MEAAWRFADEVRELWFPVDMRLYRELWRLCCIPHRNEQVLVDRLARGAALLLEHRDGLYDADDPAWQRWITLLTAWHCCHEAITQEELPDPMPALEASAATTVKRKPGMLGKAN